MKIWVLKLRFDDGSSSIRVFASEDAAKKGRLAWVQENWWDVYGVEEDMSHTQHLEQYGEDYTILSFCDNGGFIFTLYERELGGLTLPILWAALHEETAKALEVAARLPKE